MKFIHLLHKITTRSLRKCQSFLGLITIGPRAIILNEANQVLLVKHTYQEHWYLPGGGLKKGESVQQALARELKEELGLTIEEPPQLFNIYYHLYLDVYDYPVIFIVKRYSIVNTSSSEIEAIQWFGYEELPDTVSPGTRRRLKEYFEGTAMPDKW